MDENCEDTEEPIIFAEWSFVTGGMLKRRDFRLDEMLDGHTEQMSLFMTDWEYDEEVQVYVDVEETTDCEDGREYVITTWGYDFLNKRSFNY